VTIWREVETEKPPHGIPVIFFNPDWINKDFCPKGCRDGFYIDNDDSEDWQSAIWDGSQDCWFTSNQVPTHWMEWPEIPMEIQND